MSLSKRMSFSKVMLSYNRTGMRSKTTESWKNETDLLLNSFFNAIYGTTHQDPHPGLIIASHQISEPFLNVADIDLICLIIIDLLNQFAFPYIGGYSKFTILYTIIRSFGEEITFTTGSAIPLTNLNFELIEKN